MDQSLCYTINCLAKAQEQRWWKKLRSIALVLIYKQGSGTSAVASRTDVEQLNSGLLMVFNQFFVGLCHFVTIVTAGNLISLERDIVNSQFIIASDLSFDCCALMMLFSNHALNQNSWRTVVSLLTCESFIRIFNVRLIPQGLWMNEGHANYSN